MASIVELDSLIGALQPELRAVARRIFAVSTSIGRLVAPPEMEPWIVKTFGSLEAVREQKVTRVTNLVTLEGSLFNELRSRRPAQLADSGTVGTAIIESVGDPFCSPEIATPADSFGRIVGMNGLTVSNIAKFDGLHGVLVFNGHDPLAPMSADVLRDHFATARAWATAAMATDPEARYYFLLWNALWRAGSSIIHGHMQMTATRGMHYPRVEALRRAAVDYGERHGNDYFDDLWRVHSALGLGFEIEGTRVMASLTPIKEREVMIAGRLGQNEQALAPAVSVVLAALRSAGVVSHNLACYLAPLTDSRSESAEDWSTFPPLIRIVDRGDSANRTSDIGAMELYAASVISTDPFAVAERLRL